MSEIKISSPAMDKTAEKPEETLTKIGDETKGGTDVLQKSDMKSVDAAIPPPQPNADATPDVGSKKRAREDDDGVEEQRDSKKVDTKVKES